jgi:hypothetical protein
MEPMSPKALLSQLESHVGLLAATPEEQERWAALRRVPAEEMALQFYDAVPMWFLRLKESGMTDAADERVLNELNDFLSQHQTTLFLDGAKVTSAAEWETVRKLAAAALQSLRRPPIEKTRGGEDAGR